MIESYFSNIKPEVIMVMTLAFISMVSVILMYIFAGKYSRAESDARFWKEMAIEIRDMYDNPESIKNSDLLKLCESCEKQINEVLDKTKSKMILFKRIKYER